MKLSLFVALGFFVTVSPLPGQQLLPAGWRSVSIGCEGQTRFNSSEDSMTVTSLGRDIFGTSDEFQFCHTDAEGDFEATVRLVAMQPTISNGGATHGLMVREGTGADARHATIFVQPGKPPRPAVYHSRRIATGGETTRGGGPDVQLPCWLRVVRLGDDLSFYYSADGREWMPFSRASWTFRGLPKKVQIGLAVSSRSEKQETWATFDKLEVGKPRLNYVTSWLGNSVGTVAFSTPGQVHGLYVDPWEDEVFLTSQYEESGRAASRYDKNGQMLVPVQGTMFKGGSVIVTDAEFIYQASRVGKGEGDYGIRRYFKDGSVAFVEGGDNLLVLNPSPEDKKRQIFGLGLNRNKGEIYASVPANGKELDRIVVIDTATMKTLPARTFPFARPRGIAVGADGNLWIVRGGDGTPGSGGLMLCSPQGEVLRAINKLDEPNGVAVDRHGRVFVTCAGKTQQVLVFSSDGKLERTVGDLGGIYSGRAGEVRPLKLNNPVGVGVDSEGNLYVACNGNDARPHCEVRKFRPDGTQAWELLGLEFVDAVDADPATDATVLHSKNRRYSMEWERPPGQGWKYEGSTLDMQRFPEDPRLHMHHPGGVQIRRIQGKKFMFLHQMHARWLAVYRFEEESETAIPCGLFVHQNTLATLERWPTTQPATGRWIWTDHDGDGAIEASEFAADGRDDSLQWGWWVDDEGDIWATSRKEGIRRYKLQGLDATHGHPIYLARSENNSACESYGVPAGFTQVCRSMYVPRTDTLYVAGFTPEKNFADHYGQGAFGTVIARIDAWSTGSRKEVWRFDTAFYELKPDGSGFASAPKSWAVADDRFYYSDVKTATIHQHDAVTGKFLKRIIPGPEVSGGSGWHDIPHAMNARKREEGEHLLFVEEDWKCKGLIYRDGGR